MSALTLLLDLAVLASLIATLVRAVRLERALQVMRNERGAWEIAVGGLGAGTRDAQAGLIELRSTADGVAREVAAQAGRAGGLRDDLTFLVERADATADRLEHAIRAGRTAGDAGQRAKPQDFTAPELALADLALADLALADLALADRETIEREFLAALRRSR